MEMKMAIVAAVATVTTLLMIASTTNGQIVKTVDVTITNWLDDRLDLNVHCKSKEDDLGQQVLPSKQSWGFHFIPNFFGKTLFFCSFDWAGNPDGLRYFDIYKQKRDQNLCGQDCKWIVTQRGPCMFNQTSNDTLNPILETTKMATLATVAAVATIATLMMMMASTTEGQIVPQEEVTIINWLDGGLDLSLHCKSKDDDLGKQVLSSKSGWRFRFFPNVFEAKGLIQSVDVTVTNWLTGRLYLTMHCKSKQDDLGKKVIPKWQSWGWHFNPNLWGTTRFYCAFDWEGNDGGWKWFDIYVDTRDQDECFDCKWVVTQRGPCRYNEEKNSYNICYDWNK
ncbi:S-protein homolog 3 [Linum grandiflorum]